MTDTGNHTTLNYIFYIHGQKFNYIVRLKYFTCLPGPKFGLKIREPDNQFGLAYKYYISTLKKIPQASTLANEYLKKGVDLQRDQSSKRLLRSSFLTLVHVVVTLVQG